MAWHRPGDKPLSASMMISLLTHICVTRLQWVKSIARRCYFYNVCFPLRLYVQTSLWSFPRPSSSIWSCRTYKNNAKSVKYWYTYRQTSNISHTLVGNKIVDHSDVVGASPAGAAPTASSFSTLHMALMDWAKATARRDEKHLSFGVWCVLQRLFYGISLQLNGARMNSGRSEARATRKLRELIAM